MKSIIFIVSTLLVAAQCTSVVPVDQSSSTVKVKKDGHEYSYSIHESRGVAVDQGHPAQSPIPIVRAGIPQHILINNLHPKIGQIFAEVGQEKVQDQVQGQEKAEGQLKELANENAMENGMEKQPQEEWRRSFATYRLVPTTNMQYLEQPYYVPYYYGNGNHPYNFVRYY
ncbi:hypothetical protein JTB14_021698 [Gonioctena quinquepunctata]|nr:hypothetical protein JTB14_021698 [Gonioctena quinquepunctata]